MFVQFGILTSWSYNMMRNESPDPHIVFAGSKRVM